MPSKKSNLQLYADECFPIPSAIYLRSLGYSIMHAFDYNYVQRSDLFHLKKSKQLKRTLITLDRDFLYYEQIDLRNHEGVIVISTSSTTPQNINSVCNKALKNIRNEFVKDALIKITRDKITKIKDGQIIYEKGL